uniref:N-acetyltransferase domain-containing protein n=1 Tax=Sinocyclocheilus rhinocerous TaxID=307959 RepID=A0A673L0N9_9TELE
MLWYQIREYQDADYSAVRTIYSTGFREHVGTVYLLPLKQPWIQAMLCGFCLLTYILSGSILTCMLCVGGVMLATRMAMQYIFEQGIQLGLREDLLDIRNSYMQPGRSIVGTLGILPCVEEPGAWELKRISVKKEFRGRGLAKALCKTALEFVARHNVKRVVLFTSMVQTDAHKLYDSIGFEKEEEFVWPSLPARLINFMICHQFSQATFH